MSEEKSSANNITPVMRQYRALKSKNPDALLLFRLGDFYELFEDDARRAAPILELVLTQRQGVPMCGFPHHGFSNYLGKLLKQGLRVAVAEQMEDPSAAKGMVNRDIVRVVTPGTVLEEEILSAKDNNYLAAVWPTDGGAGLAWADMSTGELCFSRFDGGEPALRRLNDELGRLSPREILWPEGAVAPLKRPVTPVPLKDFLDETFSTRLRALFSADAVSLGLGGTHPAAPALSALLRYVEKSQSAALGALRSPRGHGVDQFMILDEGVIRRLDLLPDPGVRPGGVATSLWGVIDRTSTAMGGRRLKNWMLCPLMDPSAIGQRQTRVEFFLSARRERRDIQNVLRETADVERIFSRLTAGTATGRDLIALRKTLRLAPQVGHHIQSVPGWGADESPPNMSRNAFTVPTPLGDLLEKSLTDSPPVRLSDGGVIRDGYSSPLDELRALASQGRGWISHLEAQERQRTGISSLKVGFTSVFGYYLEVSKPNLSKVPQDWIRKQTLVNAERFVTPDLKAHEEKIVGSEEKARALERQLLAEIRAGVLSHRDYLYSLCEGLSETDALCSLAEVAEAGRWVRPEIAQDDVLELKESRHPVVELVLESRGGGSFVPNDVSMDNDTQRLILVTGPNMGGKSTYLRQAALAVILAQMGSYVPAAHARTGLVDRIFTRIGAGDDLAGGSSTFMVEMREVADILLHATPRSLVILDEVGRGTSTFDGLAVAWATAEYLAGTPHQLGPKVLFATHYFELTELAATWPRIKNYHAAVREWTHSDGKTELVFLHQILPGPADRSYGVHVAQMAGIPPEVVARARDRLALLESGRTTASPPTDSSLGKQRDLFLDHPALAALREVSIDRLTPLGALQFLDGLKKKIS